MAFALLTSLLIWLAIAYFRLIYYYRKNWLALPIFEIEKNKKDLPKVSILVPARNEAQNIVACINSLLQQSVASSYYEIIVLDDFSTDDTLAKIPCADNVKSFALSRFLDKEYQHKANKKRAIELGIKQAKHEIIITCDADCFYNKNWLETMLQYQVKTQAKMISAPVLFIPQNGFLSSFLQLDLISLMGITAADITQGTPSMVNGANLLFTQSIFKAVNGFQGNENIASGDDVFLMQKINAKYPNSIHFLKSNNAQALTASPSSFKAFIHQRIRWASKSAGYADFTVKKQLLQHYLFYLALFLLLLATPFLPWQFSLLFVLLFSLKTIIDYIFFKPLTIFFQKEKLLKWLLPIEFLHLLYISLVGVLALKKDYTWKEREIKSL